MPAPVPLAPLPAVIEFHAAPDRPTVRIVLDPVPAAEAVDAAVGAVVDQLDLPAELAWFLFAEEVARRVRAELASRGASCDVALALVRSVPTGAMPGPDPRQYAVDTATLATGRV